MPAKGTKYHSINIRLGKWCQDYMLENNFNQADMARRLNVNRGRITDMVNEKVNWIPMVDLVATKLLGGNWMALEKYALDEDALRYLQERTFRKSLKTKKQKLEYQQVLDAVSHLKIYQDGLAEEILEFIQKKVGK